MSQPAEDEWDDAFDDWEAEEEGEQKDGQDEQAGDEEGEQAQDGHE